ncbi:MAG: nodulation protein NfeD [Acidobacteriia bacterium]|nr:nodulation protein NfeD [Terriglobia bacterium]
MKNEEVRTKDGLDWAQQRRTRRFSFFTSLLALLLLVSAATPACAEILRLDVHDTIHPISLEYITRGIVEAKAQHADAILIRISTPGGLAESTREIIQQIVASPVPVIIYVAPSGARAASAGFFILESADIAAMAPGTNTGAAHPVTLGGGQPDKIMSEKIENDSAALMRAVAAKRGRNVEVAESAVRQSKSFTDQEALKDKLIDVVAQNDEDLLKQLDGRTITRFNGETVTLHLAGKPVREFDMTLKQKILAFLMDPNMAFVLLAIGLLALYVEFNHPGAIVPGVVGFFFVVLAVFALNILPVRYAALALILVAFVFFALEAKFVSHGILTIAGIASLVLGALLLVDAPIPEMRVRLWTALAVAIPLGVISTFLMGIALKARRGKITTGAQGLVGEIAIARTPLVPQGKVFVHGELWNAISSVPADAGEQVRVRAVADLHLEVEPVTVSSPDQRAPNQPAHT